MARNIFFSFDFDDVCATNIVRNSNVVRAENKKLPFRDFSLYEKVKNTPATIQAAIDSGVQGTSVTVIANGAQTHASHWVRYEIAKSLERGNALMVVDVDGVGLPPQPTKGPNPLDYMSAYPWSDNKGFDIGEWNGVSWASFAKLSSIRRSDSSYPNAFYVGEPYKLSQRFGFRQHWKSVQTNFELLTEVEAQAANK